ncbi:hypothetical protein MJO28_014145 [Puccinia striiformis f. sp. tritici]|uniref:Uncharacterized protein n=1 Tax=Puccinia striiformis f. sp. tritici TaxID=168172 RepID=A0ACC0DTB9_9BASI|nr:hypothetical protein MJO28_014145 [Puccinia striiformis f. sp. tritici]
MSRPYGVRTHDRFANLCAAKMAQASLRTPTVKNSQHMTKDLTPRPTHHLLDNRQPSPSKTTSRPQTTLVTDGNAPSNFTIPEDIEVFVDHTNQH